MNYLVMEVHPAYAVVLDEEGRFLKAANLHYQVGDTVRDIVELRLPREKRPALWKPLSGVAGLAACLCIVFFGYYQPNFVPYGALRIQINPDVELTLSRTDRVLELEGLNADGRPPPRMIRMTDPTAAVRPATRIPITALTRTGSPTMRIRITALTATASPTMSLPTTALMWTVTLTMRTGTMTGIPVMTAGRTTAMIAGKTMRTTGMMMTMTEIGMTTIKAEKFPPRPRF